MRTKGILIAILVYLSALIIVFMIYGLQSNIFMKIKYTHLFLAVILYLLVIILRSIKLRNIVNFYSKMTIKDACSYTGASQLVGAFIPGRAGEILLSTILKAKYGLDISLILPTLFVDKFIELCFVMMYFLIVYLVFNAGILDGYNFLNQYSYLYIIGLVVIIFVLILIVWWVKKKLPKLGVLLTNFREGFLLLFKQKKIGVSNGIISGVCIVIEFYYLYTIFEAFNISIDFSKIIIIHSIGMIIGIITLIPGGQGTTEVSMLSVLMIWGYSSSEVIFPIIGSKVVTYILLSLAAVPVLPQVLLLFRQFSKLKRNRNRGG